MTASTVSAQRLGDLSRADTAALLLRLTLGVMFIAHGLHKVLVFTPAGTAAFFASQGFPGWSAYVVIAMELLGGVALILGLYSRYVSLALVPVLLGALVVHLPNGWLFTAANGGWGYPAFLVMATLVQAVLGDGAFALRRQKSSFRLRLSRCPAPATSPAAAGNRNRSRRALA